MSEAADVADKVELGRQAFAARRWDDACTLLAAADPEGAEDLERLAVAAHLAGRDDASARAWQRAHLEFARRGQADPAVRCAFWLAMSLFLRGEVAQAGGWLGRAEHLVDHASDPATARALLLVPTFLQSLDSDPATALALAAEFAAAGRRSGDTDVEALGLLSCGQASLALGDTARGMRHLDEAMVLVDAGQVSPIPAGIVYCAVIEACMDALDLRRAAEWTGALQRWCAEQTGLVPFRGQCLVHRSQVLQARGLWDDALDEAVRAAHHLSEAAHPALGLAHYQQGELHRLRGEFTRAEQAYRAAAAHGREPAPGLALLRLAEGRVDAAVATTHRMLEEGRTRPVRPVVLAAAVDVLLAVGELDAARVVGDELRGIADRSAEVPVLDAMASYGTGAVLLALGDAAAALGHLRRSCGGWRRVEVPYEAARAQVQVGLACRALGDVDTAHLELDGARGTFRRLGAGPDLDRMDDGRTAVPTPPASGLTEREREVLRLVAAGHTNRQIAAVLVISDHTVARHCQNIFTKLGLSSRAAATAYAYEHQLV